MNRSGPSKLKKSLEISPVRWIISALILITLYFQTNFYDPFNSPKSSILLLVASWLLGYVVAFRNLIFSVRTLKLNFVLVILFVTACTLISIFTDSKFVAIFGETQRRNGFISYFSLSIIFLATSMFIRLFNVTRIYLAAIWVGLILGIYALMQSTGNDFVNWNNPYNRIIATVGNPNFAGAVMAIIGVILFGIVFIDSFAFYYRIMAASVSLMLLYLIYQSNARQGLLAYLLGAGLFVVLLLFGKNKKLGFFGAGIGSLVFLIGVLGMLQIGPLEKYLYKPSVSVRGYYWRAGLEMFVNNPILGVGMDRYGAYFKEYREVGYPLTYGYSITSSNAHNTFIQLFATGGVFLGLIYLLLNAFILRQAVVGLKKFSGNNRLLLAGVFSAWVAFHAQSLVSIDNVGISIWGWILGGSIIGISISSNLNPLEDKKQYLGSQIKINLGRVVTSCLALTVSIVPVSLLFRGEIDAYKSRVVLNSQDQNIRTAYYELQTKVIKTSVVDPSYKLNSAIGLVQNGYTDEGLSALNEVHFSDPRNLDAIRFIALTHESLNQTARAIDYRVEMSKYDKWNVENYLELGKLYKKQGNLTSSEAMLNKILSIAPNDPLASQAKIELGN
jgi:O-antigen ligase